MRDEIMARAPNAEMALVGIKELDSITAKIKEEKGSADDAGRATDRGAGRRSAMGQQQDERMRAMEDSMDEIRDMLVRVLSPRDK